MRLKDVWARLGLWRLCVVLVVLAGALAVLTVPRLRAFYFGPGGRPGVAVARVVTQPAAATAPTDAPGKKTGQRPVLPDADGRIRLRVSDRAPQRLPADVICN